jgi:hypothetical protein
MLERVRRGVGGHKSANVSGIFTLVGSAYHQVKNHLYGSLQLGDLQLWSGMRFSLSSRVRVWQRFGDEKPPRPVCRPSPRQHQEGRPNLSPPFRVLVVGFQSRKSAGRFPCLSASLEVFCCSSGSDNAHSPNNYCPAPAHPRPQPLGLTTVRFPCSTTRVKVISFNNR